MFKSLLRQEIGYHDLDENRASILASKLETSASFCKGLTSDKFGLLCQGLVGVGFAIVISFIINFKLAFAMLIFVPVSFGTGILIGQANVNTKVKIQLIFILILY